MPGRGVGGVPGDQLGEEGLLVGDGAAEARGEQLRPDLSAHLQRPGGGASSKARTGVGRNGHGFGILDFEGGGTSSADRIWKGGMVTVFEELLFSGKRCGLGLGLKEMGTVL